jgi:murein DD-endopeptidase MepM/ murein hydrolase activator NlpD
MLTLQGGRPTSYLVHLIQTTFNSHGKDWMDEQLHIIITDDRGKVLKWPCQKKKIKLFAGISAIALLVLVTSSIYAFSLIHQNRSISQQLDELNEELRNSTELFAEQQRVSEEQNLKLALQLTSLELDNIKQAVAYNEEKESLISTAVDELNDRSAMIEKIISSIGIDLPKEADGTSKDSGGPFIAEKETSHDDLLFKADRYLKTIRYLPLGEPVDGRISSPFGKRKDPINGKTAFHTGIDFSAREGTEVYATADGVVKKAYRNGGYGNYLVISHSNGYSTAYGHLKSFAVKRGERVERGQLVGQVGNTGRSTGPHLHYEVLLNKKPINPYKYLQVARLSEALSAVAERK